MERNQFLELEPLVGTRYQVAVFTPEQGMSLDPYRQTLAIASDFRRGGGRIVKSNVVGLEADGGRIRSGSEEHTSELQSLMRISYAVFCLKKKNSTETTI